MHFLKLALSSWRVGWLHTAGTVVVSSILIYSVGLMVWLEGALDPVTFRLRHERVIIAYLQPKTEPNIVDTIHEAIGSSTARKAEVVFHSSADFLKEMSDRDQDLGQQLMSLGREMSQVIPRFVSVVGTVPPGTEAKIRALPGVESVDTSESRYRPVAAAFRGLQNMSRLLALGLALAWLTVMIYMARLESVARSGTDRIIELWGGSRFQVRARALYHSLSVGILSGGLSAGLWVFTSRAIGERSRAASHLLAELSLPDSRLGVVMVCLAVLGSVLSTSLSSYRSRGRVGRVAGRL